MKNADRTAFQWLGRAARVIATAGVGLGIALASAALAGAEAQTEAEIKAGCKEAGGRYETSSGPKGRISTCSYKSGTSTMIDVFQDGNYTHTLNESKPAVPTPPQVSDPGLAPSAPPPPPPVPAPKG